MNEKGITLDRATFKALAADTRISILKALCSRRMTGAELAAQCGLSPSTIKEHLDQLEGAGLLQQVDEGRKWKYYHLTFKGRQVISKGSPAPTQVWIVLGIAVIALLYSTFNIWSIYNSPLEESPQPFARDAAGQSGPLLAAAPAQNPTLVASPAPNALLASGSFAETPPAPPSEEDVANAKVAGGENAVLAAGAVAPDLNPSSQLPTQRQASMIDWALEISLVVIVAGLSYVALKETKKQKRTASA